MKKFGPLLILSCAVGTLAPGVATAETPEARRARILAPTQDFSQPERWEALSGGSGTNRDRLDRNAFSLPSSALSFEERSEFFVGNGIFDRPWVPAPSSTVSSDGLGPLFNARSCQGCHIKDGRGHPPSPGDRNMVSMLFALSDHQGNPDPHFGQQLQDQAIVGFEAENRAIVTYDESTFTYPDGTTAGLRTPKYSTQSPLSQGVEMSPRIAPPMIGLGLIEAIDPNDIIAGADPDDMNADGISGRANMVSSGWLNQDHALGRFGWKATQATLYDQNATAFSNDMGLSTSLHMDPAGDCTESQPLCRGAFHGNEPGAPEIVDQLLDLVTFYAANVAVPARRDIDDPAVLRGKALFYNHNCIACHTPKFATAPDAPPALSNQLIWPYADFLLHDMGAGLADPTPVGGVPAAEFRTPPLWGIGLTQTVSGHSFFLHDGRARSLEEAILWHGGEAEAAKQAFAYSTRQARQDLIKFLESL